MPPRKLAPMIARVFAALEFFGLELSRDEHGGLYMAVPGYAQTDLYRVPLGGAEAALLVRQVWGAWHTPDGEKRPAVGLSNAALADVLGELRARAALCPKLPHYRRVAVLQRERVILDVGAGWRAIELTGKGWRNHNAPPAAVRFLRAPTARPYPQPKRIGPEARAAAFAKLQAFWPGIRSDHFVLLLVVLAWSLATGEDYMLVLLYGPEGQGKSTFAKLIRDLVDPSSNPLTPMPERDAMRHLMTVGAHSHMLAVDNISGMERSVADMLCQRLDGGAGQYRAHYTDSDLATVPSVGPVLLTAIAALLEFADLADRCLPLDLRAVDPEASARLARPELQRQLDALLPELFGGLLDVAAAGLAGAERFQPVPGFRGGEFARFAQAAARALGESPAAMAAMLSELTEYRRALVTRGAPVAAALVDFVTALRRKQDGDEGMLPRGAGPLWTGTATELLFELGHANPLARSDPAFPKSGAKLETELQRVQLALAALGVRLVARRRSSAAASPIGHARWVELWDTPATPLGEPYRGGDGPGGGEGAQTAR